jgi:hypothetical protein
MAMKLTVAFGARSLLPGRSADEGDEAMTRVILSESPLNP